MAEIRGWRSAPEGRLALLAQHQDPADALEHIARLRQEDPAGHYLLTGLRYRSLSYFFGPMVPLRILGAPCAHTPAEE